MRSELAAFLGSLPWDEEFRIVILGIGNALNGDDAAGVVISASLSRWLRRLCSLPSASADGAGIYQDDGLLVIEAGPSPESFSGPLRRFAPDIVILIDAAELGEPAGTVRVFHWQEAQGMSASTHGMPPTLLAKFLSAEMGCEVALVGIQPLHLDFDSPVSEEVRRAVRRVVRVFQKEIAKHL